jgi:hypothetical protein
MGLGLERTAAGQRGGEEYYDTKDGRRVALHRTAYIRCTGSLPGASTIAQAATSVRKIRPAE